MLYAYFQTLLLFLNCICAHVTRERGAGAPLLQRRPHQLSFRRAHTERSFEYTLPGGDPIIRLHKASRATLIFWKDPRMWMRVSARTMRVRVAFSIVNFVLPAFPASRPIARDKCSPRRVCNQDSGNWVCMCVLAGVGVCACCCCACCCGCCCCCCALSSDSGG
jgi:hypothetical protein